MIPHENIPPAGGPRFAATPHSEFARDLFLLRLAAGDHDTSWMRSQAARLVAAHLPILSRDAGSLASVLSLLLASRTFEIAGRALRSCTGWRLITTVVPAFDHQSLPYSIESDRLQAVFRLSVSEAMWLHRDPADAFRVIADTLIELAHVRTGRA